ncbi:MAG: ATP-binding cassette domain-containing protein [Actinobacteria bacterium]|nr:ATP-binding cassette domain-containing protein [Actinomycetota bacterium]
MTILSIKKLNLAFNGKSILNNINLEITDGKIFAVVGPNGAGKSTLASTIMGLEGYRNFQGEIFFKEQSVKELGIYERAKLGMTLGWQEPARYEGLKVSQFLYASSKDKDKNTIIKSMDIAGIDYSTYYSRAVDKSLSGGERKKIELASIVAMQPSLVILDEPDSGHPTLS